MIAALISAVCLAIMIILDRLMMQDTYDNSPAQAIIVSSIAGAVFGLASTLIWWSFDTTSFIEHLLNALSWFYPYGLLVVLAGAISSQVLHQYFICHSKDADGNLLASWIAATPLFVYLTVAVIETFGLFEAENLYSLQTITGILVATIGLYLLEKTSQSPHKTKSTYKANLAMFMVLSVLYIIVIDWTLSTGAAILEVSATTLTKSLLPWFWLGFLYGARTALARKHQVAFKTNLSTVVRFLGLIFLVEIIGMYVFFFEFVGLSTLDPVTVSLITASSAIIVWLASVGLGSYHDYLILSGKKPTSVLGAKISLVALSQFSTTKAIRLKQAACITLVLIGIAVFL